MHVTLDLSSGVANLGLNRPERKNAINLFMWQRLSELVAEVASSSAKLMVLRGTAGCFCSGADLVELRELQSLQAASDYWFAMKSALKAISALTIPTVAIIEAYCLGGGCILALNCDLRYATKDAVLGIPVAKTGYMLDRITVAKLTSLIGPGRAKELLFLSDTISGETALAIGLINGLVEIDQIEAKLTDLVERILGADDQTIRQLKRQVEETQGVLADLVTAHSEKEEDKQIIGKFQRLTN
jgi:enoyl-CoA hydratase/carnithine racemase